MSEHVSESSMHDGAPQDEGLALQELRERLRASRGPQYWRSLEELAGRREFAELVEREFPSMLPVSNNPTSRRRFLQLMGASLALAGLNACGRQPLEKIVPYVKQPEEIIPGHPLYYATAMRGAHGRAVGLLVESHMGRPTKVEGNPDHPASLGGSDIWAQASVLDLYDPDRLQVPLYLGEIKSWGSFTDELKDTATAQDGLAGAGIRVLSPPVVSPTLAATRQRLLQRYPQARWHQYEPVHRDGARKGAREAFGEDADVIYDFSGAEVVLTIDADVLTRGAGALRYTRDFMANRRVTADRDAMNRLYCVESSPTLTGSCADHRWALPPHEVEVFLVALAAELGVPGVTGAASDGDLRRRVTLVAGDLLAHRSRSIVVAAESSSPDQHVLVHAINERLGNVGRTVLHIDPVEADPVDSIDSLRALVDDMNTGHVDLLVILGGNPVYDAPSDLQFAAALEKVDTRVHLTRLRDETSEYCHWNLPQIHYMESWGDAVAYDGTVSVVQPTLEPLYDARSELQIAALLLGESGSDHDRVRAHWREQSGQVDFEKWWRRCLHDGLIEGTNHAPRARFVAAAATAAATSRLASRSTPDGLELVFRPDPTIYDGSFANNGWLQECPKPATRLTWDNTAWIAPSTAHAQGLHDGDVVVVDVAGQALEIPVWIVPGHAASCVTLHLGYGRTRAGQVGSGVGVDVTPLRTSTASWLRAGAAVHPTGRQEKLATTQAHHSMEGRDQIRAGTLLEFREHPDFAHGHGHGIDPNASMMPDWDYRDGHAWGLTVDLTSCTGCNACVIACQAENNIPIVGKDEVLNGREMHWIRIDRYYEGEPDDPETLHQPVMCMHCEQAPCEVVCPVTATVHSDEGLNDMVYNRCVGTRYCSNNCPYKVRRFNFYEYHDRTSETLAMQRNPDVTVRMRGVMEKCTYCVQRINHARIQSKRDGTSIQDGDITTACQQACPSQAIRFGDINDPDSRVNEWKSDPRNYGVLTDLGTRPRTTYLAKLSNPNSELEDPHHG